MSDMSAQTQNEPICSPSSWSADRPAATGRATGDPENAAWPMADRDAASEHRACSGSSGAAEESLTSSTGACAADASTGTDVTIPSYRFEFLVDGASERDWAVFRTVPPICNPGTAS